MNCEKRLVLIGPIAPPSWGGPAVKNRVLTRALEEQGVSVASINTIRWQRGFLRLLPTVFRQCLATPRVFLSISRKGRLVFLPLLHLCGLLRPLKIVLLPTGGLLAAELQALPSPFRRLYLGYSRRCSLILAQTEHLAGELRGLGLTNVGVLPNFKPRWRETAPRRDPSPDETRILFLSRVEPKKGIQWLFEALDRLQTDNMRFRLFIYGALFANYEAEFMGQLAHRSYASYGGVLEDAQLLQRISTCDMMVFPTLHDSEGFPGVLVDAAMAGLPVVASDLAANSEIIRDGFNGLLVRPGDIDDLAAKIAVLIRDGELRVRLGDNNKRISEHYAADTVIGGLLEQLEGIRWWE